MSAHPSEQSRQPGERTSPAIDTRHKQQGEGGRTERSGPRRALGIALIVLLALAAPAVALLSQSGNGATHRTSAAALKYGGIPSWIPKSKVRVGRLVHASAAHPWLAIQGDTVAVKLSQGRVTATAVGPQVPEEGKFPVPATTACTFTVTFTAASGVVPLSPRAFTLIDETGHLHTARVTASGGGPMPTRVLPGQTVSLNLHAVLPTGNGRLAWSPNGHEQIVSWDFDVEID
jgi:hypothetical protein